MSQDKVTLERLHSNHSSISGFTQIVLLSLIWEARREERCPRGQCARLRIERSGFEPWARFSKVPKSLRTRKAVAKSRSL